MSVRDRERQRDRETQRDTPTEGEIRRAGHTRENCFIIEYEGIKFLFAMLKRLLYIMRLIYDAVLREAARSSDACLILGHAHIQYAHFLIVSHNDV